jgi:hypothetical protein
MSNIEEKYLKTDININENGFKVLVLTIEFMFKKE